MATEYKGVPIGSLPEATSLNSSDELIAYRGGQAYRSDVGHLGETANGNISDAFSTSVSYAVGDYCIYNDTLYKCTTAHDKASWDSSHFEAVTVGEELSELNTNSQADLTGSSYVSNPGKVEKTGRTAYIDINNVTINSSPGNGTTFATVPEGYRPIYDIQMLGRIAHNNTIDVGMFTIHTTGAVSQDWTNDTIESFRLTGAYPI